MLKLRILSSVILAPPALAAVWLGGWPFLGLVALFAVIMAWEWERMVAAGRFGWAGAALALALAGALVVGAQFPAWGVVVVLAAALGLALLGARRADPATAWLALGTLYLGVPVVALGWLREGLGDGRATLLWLLAAVWATDIGAYACGRLIGGPLLAPAISPKKTWAGLLGGMAAAALAGAAVALAAHIPAMPAMAAAGAAIAVVAQAGDLAESWVKRRFGVKDSSAIIPGHGGVLDRVDGLLTAAPATALLCCWYGGGVMEWY